MQKTIRNIPYYLGCFRRYLKSFPKTKLFGKREPTETNEPPRNPAYDKWNGEHVTSDSFK